MKKIVVTTVCLEHGKPDPTPKMAYKIVPLDQVTTNKDVHVLCEALGNKLVTQNTAQAAAWHMMDNLSWEELSKKNRVESQYTGNIPWFSPFELRTAMTAVKESKRIAKTRSERDSDSKEEGEYKSEG